MFPLLLACSRDSISDIVKPDGPHDSLIVKVYVNPTLTPDTAVVSEYITVSDTIVKYDPKYEFYLGKEWDFIFIEDVIEPLTTDSFSRRFINRGLVRVQESKNPYVKFIGTDKLFVFKQLEVEKVSIEQVPPLPDVLPNLNTIENGEVVVYLTEDSIRYTRTYVLSDLTSYLLGPQEAEITEENKGRQQFIFKRGGIDRFLLLNQSNVRLVIAYEYNEIGFPFVHNRVIAMSETFNPYDLELKDGAIKIENGFLGLDGFSFELKCKWVTN